MPNKNIFSFVHTFFAKYNCNPSCDEPKKNNLITILVIACIIIFFNDNLSNKLKGLISHVIKHQ